MTPRSSPPTNQRRARLLGRWLALPLTAVLALPACGGSGGDSASATTQSPATSTTIAAPVVTVPSIDVPGSIWWLVNASRPLPPGYAPPDLVIPNVPVNPNATAVMLGAVTASAFEAMAQEANAAGFALQLNSGYRSEADQAALRDRYVQDYGAETAAKLVAAPGTSEHQTGLAADVGLVGLPDDQTFGSTPASAWVTANAYRFGFILRYPPAKAAITGYGNEPWHLRYVGPELAAQLQATGLTMEEHFGLVPVAAP